MRLDYALPKTGHPNCRRPDKVIDAAEPCPETCWSSEPRVALTKFTVACGFEDQQVSCSGLW
jgi:hypothetical protein